MRSWMVWMGICCLADSGLAQMLWRSGQFKAALGRNAAIGRLEYLLLQPMDLVRAQFAQRFYANLAAPVSWQVSRGQRTPNALPQFDHQPGFRASHPFGGPSGEISIP